MAVINIYLDRRGVKDDTLAPFEDINQQARQNRIYCY